MSRLNLAGLLILGAAAAGCQTTTTQTADTTTQPRSLFSWKPRLAAQRTSVSEEEPTPAPDLRDTSNLNLKYAQWMEDVQNYDEARKHYHEVVDAKPKNVDALLGLARVDQLSGRATEAEQGFLKAAKVAPDSPEVLHAFGQFYASQERWQEAAEMLNRAVLTAPGEAKYRYDYAVALVRVDDLHEALPHFIRTVGDAEANYNVGLILREMGRVDEAEQQMLLAVTKKPELQQAQYWLDELRQERETALAMRRTLGDPNAGSIQPTTHEAARPTASAPVTRTALPSSHAALSAPQQQQSQNQQPARW